MSKGTSAAAETQITINPQVSIVYSPEKQVLALGNSALETLGKLRAIKITSAKTLESASEVLANTNDILTEMAEVRDALATRVKEAFEPYKRFPLFHDAEINITMKIPVKTEVERAYNDGRNQRANFISAETERLRREQLAKDAEQDRINREAAAKAQKEALKQGASKETAKEIKETVLATPAPIVTSKALDNATSTIRYTYSAKITNMREFLTMAIANPFFLNTLVAAKSDIEAAFRKMAQDQKEAFNYNGITYEKKAVDVGARR